MESKNSNSGNTLRAGGLDEFLSLNEEKSIPIKKYGNAVRTLTKFENKVLKSQDRLRALGFDPIGALVSQYERIEFQIHRQEAIRDGKLVELNPNTGKPKFYNEELHMNLYDKLAKISESLMRYGYARVTETVEVDMTPKTPMIIRLTDEDEVVLNGDDAKQLSKERPGDE